MGEPGAGGTRSGPARLAVGMLCFDQPHLAPRALQGLLAQTYRNLVIRVFDNSTSSEMALSLRPMIDRDRRVSYRNNGVNIGGYLNTVQALDWAAGAGDYVAIASDHDLVEATWAERLIAELESDDRCVTAFSDLRREDERGRGLPVVVMPSVVHPSPTRRVHEVLAARGVGNAFC